MYEIGKHRSKWVSAKRNAKIGDVVLIKDKNQTQLNWPTGVIVGVKLSEDGYVRSATVKPFKRPGSSITERERDRPIHDLVLLREVPQDESNPTQPERTVQEDDEDLAEMRSRLQALREEEEPVKDEPSQ